jgi:hypothetical protein
LYARQSSRGISVEFIIVNCIQQSYAHEDTESLDDEFKSFHNASLRADDLLAEKESDN